MVTWRYDKLINYECYNNWIDWVRELHETLISSKNNEITTVIIEKLKEFNEALERVGK